MNIFNEYKKPTIELVLTLLHKAYKDEDKVDKLLKELSEDVIKELSQELMRLERDGKIDLNEKIDLHNNPALYAALRRIEQKQWYKFTDYCWMGAQIIKDSLINTYKQTLDTTYSMFGYYQTQEPRTNMDVSFTPGRITERFMPKVQITDTYITEKVLNIPWCQDGKIYSERLYGNVSQFYRKLNFVLEEGVSKGKGMDWMIQAWRKLTGSSAYDTARLLKTETMAMWSRATKTAYLEMGIEYVEIIGDAECGGVCLDYVGEAVPLAEAELGDLLPPYHPNCACSYVAYEETKEIQIDETEGESD